MPFPAPLAGLVALIALPAAAIPPQTASPGVTTTEASTLAPEEGDSGAVSLNALEQRMTVAVTINGAGPFRFIVDSGATRTVISGRLAALLKLPAGTPVAIHSVGGQATVPTVRIAALGLGAMPAKPVIAPVLDELNLGAAGILGIDALAGKKVVIDLLANRMTVEPSDRVRPVTGPDEIVVTARRKYGQLVLVDADAAGQPIYAVVDTGSMVTIANGRLRDRLIRRKRIAPEQISITDVTGRKIAALYAPVADIRLNIWHVRNTDVAFSDAHCFESFGLADKPSMLLGMDMMQSFRRVSIDFKRRTVRLMRREDIEEAPESGLRMRFGAG